MSDAKHSNIALEKAYCFTFFLLVQISKLKLRVLVAMGTVMLPPPTPNLVMATQFLKSLMGTWSLTVLANEIKSYTGKCTNDFLRKDIFKENIFRITCILQLV